MKKTLVIAMVVLVAMCVSLSVFAGEDEGLRPRRFGGRPLLGQNREGPQGPGGPHNQGPFGGFFRGRMQMGRRFFGGEEGKALRDDLLEQWKKSKDALQDERKALREKFLGDLHEGKKPREILPEYREQFRALIEKTIRARIEFLQKLLEEIRKNVGRPPAEVRGWLRERPAPLKRHKTDGANPLQD